jgi:hypothetical protein
MKACSLASKSIIVLVLILSGSQVFAGCKQDISIKNLKVELARQNFTNEINIGKFSYFGCLSQSSTKIMLFTHEPGNFKKAFTRRLILMNGNTYLGSYATGTSIPISISGSSVVFSAEQTDTNKIDFSKGVPQNAVLNGELIELFK